MTIASYLQGGGASPADAPALALLEWVQRIIMRCTTRASRRQRENGGLEDVIPLLKRAPGLADEAHIARSQLPLIL